MNKQLLTLCIIHDDEKILLALKKRGFGQGRWNGYGGKPNENETIEQAAVRETKEEAGINLLNIKKRGVINFRFNDKPDWVFEMHLFCVLEYTGQPVETDEMRPEWFKIKEIPFNDMWAGDRHWLPLFLEGKNLEGEFLFEDGGNRVIEHKIDIL